MINQNDSVSFGVRTNECEKEIRARKGSNGHFLKLSHTQKNKNKVCHNIFLPTVMIMNIKWIAIFLFNAYVPWTVHSVSIIDRFYNL